MRSEVHIKLNDLAFPNLPPYPRDDVRFRQSVVDSIDREYEGFRRFGNVDVTFFGDFVCIALTTHDQVNPVSIAVEELKAGRLAEGISLVRFLLACAPDEPNLLYLLGSALSDIGELDEAEGCLCRAIELRPTFSDAMVNLGVALDRMMRPVDAIRILRKALNLDPANAHAHRNLGGCLAKSGRDFAEAQYHFERAVQILPTDQQAWFGLAGLYFSLGQTDASRAACHRVLAIDPGGSLSAHARNLLDRLRR